MSFTLPIATSMNVSDLLDSSSVVRTKQQYATAEVSINDPNDTGNGNSEEYEICSHRSKVNMVENSILLKGEIEISYIISDMFNTPINESSELEVLNETTETLGDVVNISSSAHVDDLMEQLSRDNIRQLQVPVVAAASHMGLIAEISNEMAAISLLHEQIPFKTKNIEELWIQTPRSNDIRVIYYGASTPDAGCESHMKQHLRNLLDETTVMGLHVVGLSTKLHNDEVQVIQLSSRTFTLIVHQSNRHFSSLLFKSFLLNELFLTSKILFVGNDIIGDVAVIGALDLVPIFSTLFKLKEPKKQNFTKYWKEKGSTIAPVSLKGMFNRMFRSVGWQRDNSLDFRHDWSRSELDLTQLKHCALDAWALRELGVHAIRTLAPSNGILAGVFSTRDMEPAVAKAFNVLVRHGAKLQYLQRKDDTVVKVLNMRSRGERMLEVVSKEYASHMRRDQKVKICVHSPGGSAEGVTIEGTVDEVKGKLTKVTLQDVDHKCHIDNLHAADKQVWQALQSRPAKDIVKWWAEFENSCGEYSQLTSEQRKQQQKHHRIVTITSVESDDVQLQQIRWSIFQFVAGCRVPASYFPDECKANCSWKTMGKGSEDHKPMDYHIVGTIQNKSTMLNLMMRKALFPSRPVKELTSRSSLTRSIDFYSSHLNERQALALRRAFENRISAIQGPPGAFVFCSVGVKISLIAHRFSNSMRCDAMH